MIDVEGAELAVLRGFPWGEVPVSMTLCEMHPYAWKDFGYDAQAMTKFMRERGLLCLDMFLGEHRTFTDEGYIGPTLLLEKNRPGRWS